jgi:hypothetical protein
MRQSPSAFRARKAQLGTQVLKLTIALDWLEETIRTIGSKRRFRKT